MKFVARWLLAGAAASVSALGLGGGLSACSSLNSSSNGFLGGTDDGGSGDDDSRDATVPGTGAGNDGGGIFVLGDAGVGTGACTGIACQQQACTGGATTSLSGTVYAPNGTLPIYDAIVYVPNAPLAAIDAGISCDQCGTLASGDPIVTTLTDSAGHFSLTNVPVGTNIPLVVQLGKWRRQTTIATVSACVDNPITDPNLTRLPKNQQEGNMPHIALTTGQCDSVGCMLGKLGIDVAEFGVESDGPAKAIHVYSSDSGGFSDGLGNTSPANKLWTSLPLLETYDIGIFSCECSEGKDSKGTYGAPAFQAVTDYLNAGGRIFTTDFQYVWYKYSPDPNLGAVSKSDLAKTGVGVIGGGAPSGDNPLLLNESFPKGLALGQWLSNVFPANPLVAADGGALVNNTKAGVTCDEVFDNVSSLTSNAQLWSTSNSSDNFKSKTYDPRVFTVNTPAGQPTAEQCGKGVHIDAHITEANQGDTDFVGCNGSGSTVGGKDCYPNTCTDPLKEDEAMFAFFFFDLSSCIQNEATAPVPPPPSPR